MELPGAASYRTRDEAYRQPKQLAISTYRYLRIGMVMAVVAIVASILIERSRVACMQTSISAYYYTPARAIFVAALITIGANLIIIKGSNLFEDTCLNVAGFFAPLVALVPTEAVSVHADGRPLCVASASDRIPVDPIRRPGDDDIMARWLRAAVDNNVNTLLIVGGLVTVLAFGLSFIRDRNGTSAMGRNPLGHLLGLMAAAALLVGIYVAKRWWGSFYTQAHGYAAVAMFVFLALAVIGNAVEHSSSRRTKGWFWIYAATAVCMVVLGTYFQLLSDSRFHVLIVESIEITAFAVFWVAQTVEHWSATSGAQPTGPSRAGGTEDLFEPPARSGTAGIPRHSTA